MYIPDIRRFTSIYYYYHYYLKWHILPKAFLYDLTGSLTTVAFQKSIVYLNSRGENAGVDR